MEQYKIDFIELLVRAGALKFGEFTLKSGRVAPYFLNVGSFYTGELLTGLARAYAQAFLAVGVEAEVIFGPAYKGIPLSVATVAVLSAQFKKEVSYCFNRKEAKDHGEKSLLVGAPLNENTKVFLIDDVITAGTAIRETMEILKNNGNPQVVGVLIAMDRMEKNNEGVNAVRAIEEEFKVPVFSIVNLDEVVKALHGKQVGGKVYIDGEMMEEIADYRRRYGV
ncbi:orotate phosphoribosyltransferase [Candidatus Peregrinibacteria bacterium]|nr:orotate phosphoribosyltransferase [Candidatus Peregrinibacteria bacterium]